MKPRIKKKLSKKIAEIVNDKFGMVWIDNEYCLYRQFWPEKGHKLSGNHERINRNMRVSVNHMPVVGGGSDYYGEYNEPYTVVEAAINVFAWTFFEKGPEDEYGCPGYPVITERMTGKWLIKKSKEFALMDKKA